MTTPVLKATGLSKKYATRTRHAIAHGLRDVAAAMTGRSGPADALRATEFWALDGVDVQVCPGEALGVVGVNGAGKSTLLRILYGLTKPDRGTVDINGRVGGLLDVGTGFDPVLSGLENAAGELALHGDAGATPELIDAVVDFADIGSFIDAPVRTYSQGMRMRLGYAIAATLDPAVLLIDEVLAVGDFAFRKKCGRHLRSYLDRGGAIVLVSHSVWVVQSLCDRAIVLDHGSVSFDGDADAAVRHYLNVESLPETGAMVDDAVASNDGLPIAIEAVEIEARNGGPLRHGETATIEMLAHSEEPFDDVIWAAMIWSGDESAVVAGDFTDAAVSMPMPVGTSRLNCTIDALPLNRGDYTLRVAAIDPHSRIMLGLHGFSGGSTRFSVEGEGRQTVFGGLTGAPLTTLDVEWT